MPEVMLDIESFGLKAGAAPLSIGAIRFVPGEIPTPEMLEDPATCFRVNIDAASAQRHGLVVDGATVNWWMGQPEQARRCLYSPAPKPLPAALASFAEWLLAGEYGLWSKGKFDFEILEAAYLACGVSAPWHYRQVRDLRTLLVLAFGNHKTPMYSGRYVGTEHVAIYDAYNQVVDFQSAWRVLRGPVLRTTTQALAEEYAASEPYSPDFWDVRMNLASELAGSAEHVYGIERADHGGH